MKPCDTGNPFCTIGKGVRVEELQHLGSRLRDARRGHDLTLEELANLAGISASTLSRLESGKRQASLELLLPLTRLLGVSLDALIAPTPRDPRVSRQPLLREGVTIAPLTRQESLVRAFKITYRPDAPDRAFQTHEGHEWLYVLSGRIHLELGDQSLVLESGEAAEFDTTTPHRLGATGAQPAEVISIFNAAGERVHVHSQHRDPGSLAAPVP